MLFAAQPALSEVTRSLPGHSGWSLYELVGRLVELSGQQSAARLTAALGLVLETQLCGDHAAWVTFEHSAFFPPDAAAGGIDVESLPVVRIPSAVAAGRAAEHLVRSGGFGLVVVDLSSAAGSTRAQTMPADLPVSLLTRLLGLVRAHHAVLLLLTQKPPETASLNSLISLRAEARWCSRAMTHEGVGSPSGFDSSSEFVYDVCVRVIKDKRRAPGWEHVEACRGAMGMR